MAKQYIEENGENPMGCGFAWVEVKKVYGKKLSFLKVNGFKKNMLELDLVFGILLKISHKIWMQNMLVLSHT